MKWTQIEITLGDQYEVWWIPVGEGKAKVGEKITKMRYWWACSPAESNEMEEVWTISQVCTTLSQRDLPSDAKIAYNFKRNATTIQQISM